jgi:predicted DNA-binding transcriptional regulator YafY
MANLGHYGLPLPPSNRRIASTSSKVSQYPRLLSPIPSTKKIPSIPARQAAQPPPLLRSTSPKDVLGIIRDCAHRQKVVRISYTKKTGESIIRDIEPYSIKYMNAPGGSSEPYLYAACQKHRNVPIHSFRVSNIGSAEELSTTYNPQFLIEL